MLDQNTDRMWFVIGAVIVGAAIIFIANGTIPELFASVSESFDDTAQQSTDVIDGITPYGSGGLIQYHRVTRGKYVHQDSGLELDDTGGHRHSSTDYIEIDPAKSYIMTAGNGKIGNMRAAYFDDDQQIIPGGVWKRGAFDEIILENIPANAAYVRLSAVDAELHYAERTDTRDDYSPYTKWTLHVYDGE